MIAEAVSSTMPTIVFQVYLLVQYEHGKEIKHVAEAGHDNTAVCDTFLLAITPSSTVWPVGIMIRNSTREPNADKLTERINALPDATGQIVYTFPDEFNATNSDESAWDNYFDIKNVSYRNLNGEEVFRLDGYTDCGWFSEGLVGVRNSSGKWGYADKQGNIGIACKYDSAGVFNDGLAVVKKNGKYGYINKKGKVVIPIKYKDAYGAGNGLAVVVNSKGKCGAVNYKNKTKVKFVYDDLSSFKKGTAYDIKGKTVYILTK